MENYAPYELSLGVKAETVWKGNQTKKILN
jgi:hypothetical protein